MNNDNDIDIRIVVLQRGWVAVGVYSRDGEHAQLASASFVRRWGTDQGLGQLAREGPRPNTRLDPAGGVVEFHSLGEILNIRCCAEKWVTSCAP